MKSFCTHILYCLFFRRSSIIRGYSEIPVAQRLNRAVDEDEQVRRLVAERGGGLTAGSLWKHCGTRIGNSRVALRAQRELIAILDEAKNSLVTQNRLG